MSEQPPLWPDPAANDARKNRNTPDPLRDLMPPSHRDGPDTEKTAAAGIRERAGELRVLTMRTLAGSGGLTNGEMAHITGKYLYSISPRTTELKRDGLVRDTGRRRTSDHGRPAIVWELTDEGRVALTRIDRGGA